LAIRRWAAKPGFLLALVLVVISGLAPEAAWGHALLVGSLPAADSQVKGPDIAVTLRYNSRVDSIRSAISLLGPDGQVKQIEIEPQSAPNLLSAKISGLVLKGAYVLRWQALASDGHITRGEVPFHVQ
jgi:hypothetical protein